MKERFSKYNNTAYWTDIHRRHEGRLQAVGHPTLSKKLNELKYESEANTILRILQDIGEEFRESRKEKLSVLDVGAGAGYWSKVVHDVFQRQGFTVEVSLLDISQEALDVAVLVPSLDGLYDGIRARSLVKSLGEQDAAIEVYREGILFTLKRFFRLWHLIYARLARPGSNGILATWGKSDIIRALAKEESAAHCS
jgi:hypothetical protein